MSYVKNTITLLLSIFIVNVSFSQVEQNVNRLDEVYKDCCNKNHGEYGAANCAIDLSKKWDEEMNKYYKGLMNILDAKAQKDLKQAQNQWTTYRDLESKFSSSLHDMQGTIYIRLAAYRRMRIIRTRALELKSYYWTRTEEEEPQNRLLNNLQIITQESIIDTVLPTPDSTFMNSLVESGRINAEYVIKKYIETYLSITKKEEVLKKTYHNGPDKPGEGCLFRTEYNNGIALENDYGCDSYQMTTTVEFNNYSLEEVKRVLKILLPTEYTPKKDQSNADDYEGWNEEYTDYIYDEMCSLSIYVESNKILVTYGCSC